MAGVVHTGLQAVGELDAKGGLETLEVLPELHATFGLEDIGEVRVVSGKVGKLILVVIVLEKGTLLLADVLDFISATFQKQINMIWMISLSLMSDS